ncbi:LuxR C-terminal-related transcriptional regulator [Dyella sp. C9]|uniref:LuxR C-terminal-related transcriptional regulator n=1 Tax=Dyella sp. C9 TaxID=2202154 RepID=UPI0018E50099|nr:LuxR C-terminal-related transcriptional regulator [Dyella sp. C9]
MHEPEFERSLFSSIQLSPIATLVTNPRLPDNPIVCANPAFRALTGYDDAEVIGRNCRFLSGPDTEPDRRKLIRDAVAQCRPLLTVLRNYRKDGTSFLNAVMIAPILGADGRVNYFIGSQMDVTAEQGIPPNPRALRAAAQVQSLTPRQRQVLEQMVRGHRNKQIAALLGIEEKTVKMHRASLLRRLGAASTADAIRIGIESQAIR